LRQGPSRSMMLVMVTSPIFSCRIDQVLQSARR
jgi:hypothetical protein